MLKPEDASSILNDLIEAKNQYYVLGLQLNIPAHDLDAIKSEYSNPGDGLLQVILAFLRQDITPTWRVIIDALRTPSVNLHHLASRLEVSHSTSAQPVVETTGSIGTRPIIIYPFYNNKHA